MKKLIGLTLLSFLLLLCSQCNRSDITLSPVDNAPDSSVFAMAVYNNELYVGGCFDSVANIKSKYIAKWDGQKWTSVGKGLNTGYRGVEALIVYKGELYAAGDFNYIDTIPVDHIAKWNGKEWTPVGNGKTDGVFPYVTSLCVYKDELYAASRFDSLGGIKANNIAKWNGQKWDTVGNGINYTVISLAVYKDELYAGGVCDKESGNLVKWNGQKWISLGKGITTNWSVQSYAIYQDKLITAGTFDSAGGQPAEKIANWDGNKFEPFEKGIEDKDASMVTMAVFKNDLFLGGRQNKNVITKWDNQRWQTVATTDSIGYVSCFVDYNGDFFAGGSFRFLNGQPIKYLTKLTMQK